MKQLILILVFLCLLISPLWAAKKSAEEQLYFMLLNQLTENPSELFADAFLAILPPAKITEIVLLYRSQLGNLERVEKQEKGFTLHFEKGTAPSTIAFDEDHKVASIWFGTWKLSKNSLDDVKEAFAKIKDQYAITLLRNGTETLFDQNGTTPMAVGSAFKLFILKEIIDRIGKKQATWSDALPLQKELMSLPTGFLQNWPENSSHTLETMAGLMISISDNTATDHLLEYVGREKIEKYLPEKYRPILSTSEMFRLKSVAFHRVDEWLAADLAGKRKILTEIRTIPHDLGLLIEKLKTPLLIDQVEWFFTTQQLAEVIYQMRENSLLTINPGLVSKKDWYRVGYKGGSECGVLNYTLVLQKSKNSPIYSLSATVNNQQTKVDESIFNSAVLALISLIDSGKVE